VTRQANPHDPGVDGHPEVMPIHADGNSVRATGEQWHSDVSCDLRPPMGSILRMHTVPDTGGDTLFANMYAAYEALSEPAPARSVARGEANDLPAHPLQLPHLNPLDSDFVRRTAEKVVRADLEDFELHRRLDESEHPPFPVEHRPQRCRPFDVRRGVLLHPQVTQCIGKHRTKGREGLYDGGFVLGWAEHLDDFFRLVGLDERVEHRLDHLVPGRSPA